MKLTKEQETALIEVLSSARAFKQVFAGAISNESIEIIKQMLFDAEVEEWEEIEKLEEGLVNFGKDL